MNDKKGWRSVLKELPEFGRYVLTDAGQVMKRVFVHRTGDNKQWAWQAPEFLFKNATDITFWQELPEDLDAELKRDKE